MDIVLIVDDCDFEIDKISPGDFSIKCDGEKYYLSVVHIPGRDIDVYIDLLDDERLIVRNVNREIQLFCKYCLICLSHLNWNHNYENINWVYLRKFYWNRKTIDLRNYFFQITYRGNWRNIEDSIFACRIRTIIGDLINQFKNLNCEKVNKLFNSLKSSSRNE